MPDNDSGMRTNADRSVTLTVRGVHPLHAALLDDRHESGPLFFLTYAAKRVLWDSFLGAMFPHDEVDTKELQDAPR